MFSSNKQSIAEFENLLGTAEFFTEPFPVYDHLRERAPIYWCSKWNAWLVTRQADINKLIRDTGTLSNTRRHTMLLGQLPKEHRCELGALHKHFEGQGIINSDPHQFDIGRSPKDNKHLVFGAGNHSCLGASLFRLEGELAFTALPERSPNLALAGDPHWKPNVMVRFLEHLPLTATPQTTSVTL